ncbi:MAG: class II glutamine amidotransferase [Gammaproteobacteria bacterium]|nr:class II glutamine amidotransferase [Gammaproteobacteria bacterium]
MCRWIAYSGKPIFLEDVLVKPSHSLLRQSRFAEENFIKDHPSIPDGPFPTNDDGFGIGWYDHRDIPGLYRDVRPAWNDENYLTIAAQVKSGLFMAHLRAAYQGFVQRTNCHPFRHHNWLFQHNGEIEDFSLLKRDIALLITPELFPCIEGTTDTEWFFYLAISLGLFENPKQGIERAIAQIEQLKIKHGIKNIFRLTACISDGTNLYAVRYASIGREKSLYINKNHMALNKQDCGFVLPQNAKLLVSEPLSDVRQHWDEIPKHHFVKIEPHGAVSIAPITL